MSEAHKSNVFLFAEFGFDFYNICNMFLYNFIYFNISISS